MSILQDVLRNLARSVQLIWPTVTIMIGDKEWKSIGPNVPANDLFTFQNNPAAWWHPDAFRRRKAVISFADGHSQYTTLEILVLNTENYRKDP